MHNTNVITIEKNVPMPEKRNYSRNRYTFLKNMVIGDSFVINGNTPDFSTNAVRSHVYGIPHKTKSNRRYSVRTLAGSVAKPVAIRVWRVK